MASSDTTRVFRVSSPLRVLTPLILISLFTVGLIYAISRPSERGAVPLVAAVLAFSVVFCFWLLTRTRLEVSAQEITYYSIGYRVHSAWDNVAGYGKRTLGAQSVESLILHEPGIEVSRWMRIGYALMPVAEVASAARGRVFVPRGLAGYQDVIPVALFDRDWRSSDLGALVQRYAPQAFDNLIT